MTDTEKLRNIISEKGIKICKIAEQIGISQTALRQKMSNEREFKPSEIKAICELLGIKGNKVMQIFFAENVYLK